MSRVLTEYRVRLIGDNAPDAKETKLGGAPTWIQGDETPCCEECNQSMTFFAQLDSISDEYMFGDAGMLYVFACDSCGRLESLIQGY